MSDIVMEYELEPWNKNSGDFDSNHFYYKTSRSYRIWFEFLRLSPTYELARQVVANRLSETKLNIKLPNDIEDVISTYEDFGDVRNISFSRWWNKNCDVLFGKTRAKPSATELMRIPFDVDLDINECVEKINSYLSHQWDEEGKSEVLLVAIPLTGSKNDLIESIKKMIDPKDISPVLKPNRSVRSYALLGERQQLVPLSSKLRLLWTKADNPKLELWRLGVNAKLSKSYSRFDTARKKLTGEMCDETPKIASATSHALSDAIYTMENAARGRFPCTDKITLPAIDYLIMRKVIEQRLRVAEMKISEELSNKLIKLKEEHEKEVGVGNAEDFLNVLLRKTLSDRKLRLVVAKKD